MNNWQGKFEDKQHALEGALYALQVNKKAILKHGVSDEVVFVLGDKTFTLTAKGFKK